MGIVDNFTISLRASVDSLSGHDTLIMSAPALADKLICSNVASISVVRVFVIV